MVWATVWGGFKIESLGLWGPKVGHCFRRVQDRMLSSVVIQLSGPSSTGTVQALFRAHTSYPGRRKLYPMMQSKMQKNAGKTLKMGA